MQGVEEANRLMDAGGGITALGSWVGFQSHARPAAMLTSSLRPRSTSTAPKRPARAWRKMPGIKRILPPRLLVFLSKFSSQTHTIS